LARKILLADDSVTAQNMGRRILSDAGYEVITVNNGSAALKKIAEIVPDLIVLDVYMPGYGGLEVCQRLKESQATARIPVLLTVGKLEPFKVEEARRVRADGHIVKPFDSTELLAAIIKLEDKIVPQPALTKQGRSAKASGSLEASSPRRGRDKSADPGSETTSGWKKRLSIPRNGPVPDAPSDAEETKLKTASTTFHDFTSSENQKPAEAKLPDAPIAIAAAPETPSDVESPSSARPFENFTVERLVAMEASAPAAEVPTLLQEVETKPEPTVSEVPAVEMKLPEAVTPETPVVEAPAVDAVAFEPSPAAKSDSTQSERSPGEDEVTAALASLSPANEEPKFNEGSENSPATALSAALAAVGVVCGGPRWIAEPVPLSDGDSHLILECEMEKAYAAFASAETARMSAAAIEQAHDSDAPAAIPVMASAQSPSFESVTESQPISHSSDQEFTPILETEIAEPSTAENTESMLPAPVEAAPEAAANEAPNGSSVAEIPEVKEEPAAGTPVEAEITSIGYREIAYAAAASAGSQPVETNRSEFRSFAVHVPARADSSNSESPNASFNENLVQPMDSSEAMPTPSNAASPTADVPASTEGNPERESQLAAAWQNWRQIRESIVGPQLTSQITDAAAAGFKQIRGEEPLPANHMETEAAASNRVATEASTIAGIVDSVFAELKPKLMEEIAKKLAADRK
jgi:CheY-like chemotaxis protein